jgi:hypothetical protein
MPLPVLPYDVDILLIIHYALLPLLCLCCHANIPQAVAAQSRSSSTRATPLRPSTRAPAALRVVAFREDDNVRRGIREAKGQAKNVQRQGQRAVEQGKQQLQRGRNDLNRRECCH